MRFEPTSISIPGVIGFGWKRQPSDKKIAKKLFIFLERRRVLTGHPRRSVDDLPGITRSVIKIADRLTETLENDDPGDDLERSVRRMRSDSLTFLDQAGIDGKNFRDEIDVAHRLGEYHARLGEQLAALAIHHDVEFEDALAHIMPSESVEWMPKMISLED
ncbi:DUF6650 family protein [Actinoplanes sp. NPDC089786]|uniref:DUF6650 family protein n=1 Tax=Actinoplanes sp. NPDC089786 TaxID=3155185 RepID=UPI00344246EE